MNGRWRRLAGGLGLLAALFAGAARGDDCPPATAIGDGIHVVAGRGGAPGRDDAGRAANSVILVGASGVTVVDPGPNRRSGEALLCAIGRLTDRPVVALVATHPHPENVLAGVAFDQAAAFHASAATAVAMAERCTRCIERLTQQVGQAAMAGTLVRIPDQTVAGSSEIAPGGRRLRLIPLGPGHSPGDLAVLDLASGTLIAGDVGNVAELPDLRDGTLDGSLAALRTLLAVDARVLVPGRGPTFAPERLRRPLAYLEAVAAAAREAAAAGDFLLKIDAEAAYADEFGRFAELHPLNLQHAYREAEAAWWAAGKP